MSAPPLLRLPRGGVIVTTSAGKIQLGAPPETIKDAMEAGIDVPSTFVLPSQWFSARRGLAVAELEFPVYYNWFLRHRRVRAVCDEHGRDRLRAILRESLFGPERVDAALDHAPSVPAGARADLLAESRWFRRKDGDPLREIQLDEVLEVALYDRAGRAHLGAGVEVEKRTEGGATHFRVWDGGALVADLTDEELAPTPLPAARRPPVRFEPPAFGITVLGSSHGFDPSGKTTGFVLWINHRGVLVDPPSDSTATLAAAGVMPAAVDAVILTHCHADHDAGVLQKILEAGRVHVYTTPTILGSFLRKVGALTGESEEHLRRLFVFRPVTIGGPLRIQGAAFRFFYSLHAIPTIGFECFYGGQSFVYSSDTLYDPPRIEELFREGIIGRERRDALLAFPFHHSLVVHEAGVPPIHTPAARLAELAPEIKQRLRIIHIAERDLPEGAGLRLARTGFDETITLAVEPHPHAAALEVLDALVGVDLLNDFTVERCRDFLTVARRERHAAGALIIGQGEPGDAFYIIVSGEASVVRDGVILKTYRDGDFFGETALLTSAPRSADVRAKTDVDLVAVDKYDFLALLRGTDLAAALVRLAQNRDLPSWDLMSVNTVLRHLRAQQRTGFQAALEHRVLAAGEVLWSPGDVADSAWLLDDATVDLVADGNSWLLGRAAFLCNVESLLHARQRTTRAVVRRGGGAFRVAARHLAELLERSPALLLALTGVTFVE